MPIVEPVAQPLTAEFGYDPVGGVPRRPNGRKTAFVLAIFLSAFLLFQVELLLGKQLLPIFGGAPAVWTSCLLVFQLLLLTGYTFAHGIAIRLTVRQQGLVLLSLLGLSLCIFATRSVLWSSPITPFTSWNIAAEGDPTWTIVKLLLLAIGLPFFILSTTSPLALHWMAKNSPGNTPYRFYALSSVGSLLGLVSYPFLVEPNLRLRTQSWLWTAAYAIYAVAYATCAMQMTKSTEAEPVSEVDAEVTPSPTWSARLLWVSLAACASVLLLATTNYICQELAVIPFLWVLPLALYLTSFIFCFESDRWYRRGLFQGLFVLAASAVILEMLPNSDFSMVVRLSACSALLFIACMVCHGEAARTRPAADHLTQFYLCISLGGALGGIFVSVISPRIFPNDWEYPLGILSCAGLILFVVIQEQSSWWYKGRTSIGIAFFGVLVWLTPVVLGAVWPPAAEFPRWGRSLAAGALFALAAWLYIREKSVIQSKRGALALRLAARCGLAVLTAGLAIPQKAALFHVVARSRNFYGVLSVIDAQPENYLALRHGSIVHGFQFEDAERHDLATGYYGENSAANILIRTWPHHPMRIGLVGMGTGTLAAIGQPGDVYRFYEINPDVYQWSQGPQPHFTFLKDSSAKVEVVLGDARGSLQREAQQNHLQKFDVLVLDAFSSDAIPMHLLTRQAFQIFVQHLRGPESAIAIHISNRTLDLAPVVAGLAQEFGMHAVLNLSLPSKSYLWQSEWVLLSRNEATLNLHELKPGNLSFATKKEPILWTDDYSNLFHVIR
jgi:hypothetical protein